MLYELDLLTFSQYDNWKYINKCVHIIPEHLLNLLNNTYWTTIIKLYYPWISEA